MNLILPFFILLSFNVKANNSSRYELLSGVRKSNMPKQVWDKRYSSDDYIYGKAPAKFLSENLDFIPKKSKILDVGMGEGRNAVFLASKGHKVTGVDISSVAVRKARMLAKEFDVRINTIVASMDNYKADKNGFDVIICFYYVDKKLNDRLLRWLKPGGLLIYESHTLNQLRFADKNKIDKKFLLAPGELLNLFSGHKVLKYEEPLHRDEYTSSIILQKL